MFQRLFVLILCTFNIQTGPRCRLNSRTHFGEPLPIILRDGRLLEPDEGDGSVNLNNGDIITLSCEGSGFISHPNAKRQVVTADVECDGGTNFKNDNWLIAPAGFILFRCNYPPNYSSQRTNRTCFEDNPVIEVGYKVQNEFYPLYESCFDENKLNPIYSKYRQEPHNAMYQQRVDRPFFIDDNGYYGSVPVNSLFSPPGQKSAVAQLVGSVTDSYFTKDQHLSRGHLAAKTDFPLAFSERATFHYVNCAPQWTGFNGGNWNTLEIDLRNHIHHAGYKTIIYTGTFRVSNLISQSGRAVDIYLYTDFNNNPVIPVPKYFYKVVYEPTTQRGIAFVGINNPFYTAKEARNHFFCEDVCRNNNNFRWLTWHPDSSDEGYTFCCNVQDFTNTVRHLPQFEVKGLLT